LNVRRLVHHEFAESQVGVAYAKKQKRGMNRFSTAGKIDKTTYSQADGKAK
jgi:hypothetical protein